jgi:hypothetical protein
MFHSGHVLTACKSRRVVTEGKPGFSIPRGVDRHVHGRDPAHLLQDRLSSFTVWTEPNLLKSVRSRKGFTVTASPPG